MGELEENGLGSSPSTNPTPLAMRSRGLGEPGGGVQGAAEASVGQIPHILTRRASDLI